MNFPQFSAVFTLLVATMQPALAQHNPFELLYPDTLILIEVPDGLDVQEDSANLLIGAETDSGEKMSHTAKLKFTQAVEGTNMRAFAIPIDDLKEFQLIVNQMQVWKDEDLHGNGNFEMDFKICRYGLLPKGDSTFIFGMLVEHIPNSATRFGQLDYETLVGSQEFTNEIVRECVEE